jgi:hypothetical protein
MAASLWAEIVAICTFSLRVVMGRDSDLIVSTATRRPRSRPRLKSMALAPAVTLRRPSAKMAWASTVDVVVPSPTESPVRSAA